MILRALMLCLVCTACAALHGVEFPDTRIEFGQSDGDPTADDGSEPQIDIKTPWGLWANRGPYPYYDGPFGIDTQDDLVARDIWFDFH
ncbi:MAG: hypothetical protein KDB29_05785, partial [Planctomycetes bacterium]|nr:hypothetical protein [Planctomycetota bacterium]